MSQSIVLAELKSIVGRRGLLTSQRQTAPYRIGFREGKGSALAVVIPKTLLEMWHILQVAVTHDLAIVMQAANTGLTGGSTPTEDCDRNSLIISTRKLEDIHLLQDQAQIVAFPGASLFQLEKLLTPLGRKPHSVIGSSCIGASIVGGICNNSGGALVERGPAYTELSLYAEVDESGQLNLVNNLDISLGDSVEEILTRLQNRDYIASDILSSDKKASDNEYKQWVRDTNSQRPSRFNADQRRLHQASGCAGKLAVFAVRVDSFVAEQEEITLMVGSNDSHAFGKLRVAILEQARELPISAEYLHKDIFDITDTYGRETMLLLRAFGTQFMPTFFNIKRKIDSLCSAVPLISDNLFDRIIYFFASLFPSQIPDKLKRFNQQYQHQLILTVKGKSLTETTQILDDLKKDSDLNYFRCDDQQAKQAYMVRFAAAGAAIQFANVHNNKVAGLLALDIALPRNCKTWFETLPHSLQEKIEHRFYYGHFICHVFHQDYIVKQGYSLKDVKKELLEFIDSRGAEYPAEHNVGQLYQAKPALKAHYQKLDPTNTFNPGIGKTSKNKHYH